MVLGNEHVVEEHLVELGFAGDLDEWPRLDALGLHVHHEIRDPSVLRQLWVGASEADAPPGEVRVARPHLLPVQHPTALDRRRFGGERCQIRAGAGLTEELAPDLTGVEDRRQPAPLLLVVAVSKEWWTGEVDARSVYELDCARARVLHVEDGDLDRRGPPASVLRGPMDPDPPIACELGLPLATPLDLFFEGGERRWELEVRLEPGADLVGEGLLFLGEGEIHSVTSPRSARGRGARTRRGATPRRRR